MVRQSTKTSPIAFIKELYVWVRNSSWCDAHTSKKESELYFRFSGPFVPDQQHITWVQAFQVVFSLLIHSAAIQSSCG